MTDKPWRETLQIESSAPTVETIHEHFRQRVSEADVKRRADVDELNRARATAMKELWPEDFLPTSSHSRDIATRKRRRQAIG